MSKDDACKVTSASKHKERKPKKPHYIPRPWGKPYNYKCFQCPFTCMEKSHLYNHMKYSLCKNSLSLLIESDWPYKKGNILHPDQLRPFQQGHGVHAAAKDELEAAPRAGEAGQAPRRGVEDEVEGGESRGPEDEEEGGRGEGAEVVLKEGNGGGGGGGRGDAAECGAKKAKPAEPELLMADMLSLEDQLLRARSVEVEAQLKHYKLSKTYLTAPGMLSEQWRLLASSHTKAKGDGAQPRASGSIPCYPPPPNMADYQDPAGLNLSVLGVGYPLGPGLFSYMNSLPSAAAAGLAAQAQLAQLPFLASAAQLMHPASGADRAPLAPPRLYYPFLCEHAFGQSDAGKALKVSASGLETSPLSGFQPKVNLWKVPALRPGAANANANATAISPAGWVSPQRESPDQAYRVKEGKASWGLKRTGAPMGNNEAPAEKKPAAGFTLDFLKNIQTASMAPETLLYHSGLQDARLQTRPSEPWFNDPLASSETAALSASGASDNQDPAAPRPAGEGGASSEAVAALLADLSKALQEYQEAERRISRLQKEDLPAQRHLWEHLSKIRSELSHIHQALERTARQSDGPLDLSVKRCPTDPGGDPVAGDDAGATETEEDEEEGDDGGEEDGGKASARLSLESRKQSLDVLIRMSQSGSADALSPAGLGMRPGPAEALWPGRTTKCEADSSVLLCPDGRSVVFADVPSAAKTPKRPPSIQRLEAQGPPSPLTVTDN